MTEHATGQCVGRTRDGRRCAARATTVVTAKGQPVLHVCGTHRTVHEETAFAFGNAVATKRVLTGARP